MGRCKNGHRIYNDSFVKVVCTNSCTMSSALQKKESFSLKELAHKLVSSLAQHTDGGGSTCDRRDSV